MTTDTKRLVMTRTQVLEALAKGEREGRDDPRPSTINDLAETIAVTHPDWVQYAFTRRADHIRKYVDVNALKTLLDGLTEDGTVRRLRGTELADPPHGVVASAWYYFTPAGIEQEAVIRRRIREERLYKKAREEATHDLVEVHQEEFNALVESRAASLRSALEQ